MMLHQDRPRHEWLAGLDAMDLIVTMDDATNEICSAFLLPEEDLMQASIAARRRSSVAGRMPRRASIAI